MCELETHQCDTLLHVVNVRADGVDSCKFTAVSKPFLHLEHTGARQLHVHWQVAEMAGQGATWPLHSHFA